MPPHVYIGRILQPKQPDNFNTNMPYQKT